MRSEEVHHYFSRTDTLTIDGEEVPAIEITRTPEKYGYSIVPYRSEADGKVHNYYVKPICGQDLKSDFGEKYDQYADLYGMSIVKGNEYFNEVWQNTVPKEVVKFIAGTEAAEAYDSIGTFVSLGSAMSYYYQNYMNASDENGIELAKMMYAYSVTSLTVGVMISSVNPLAGVLWNIATGFGRIYLQKQLDKYYKNSGHLRLIIDPSGIVFEAVIDNPVEGATVTIYFKDAETGETIKCRAYTLQL